MAEILHSLPVIGPRSKVYAALTERQGLSAWWTRYVVAEPEVGFVNLFGFGGAFKFEMRVDELEPGERVKWTCLGGHPEWEGTIVTFDLEDMPGVQGTTLLHFAHTNWQRADGVMPNCSYDWAQYLRSLKMLIEKGEGNPS